MQIDVRYLDNLKVEANFDDFKVIADQPIRYKGDGSAPGPFDYFLASSVLCAAYFVKIYCKSRNIPTDDIKVTQDNIVSPDNRYEQKFVITVELPSYISPKDKKGILASIDRCTVKKTIQEGVDFSIRSIETLQKTDSSEFDQFVTSKERTTIIGKDSPLEESILKMTNLLKDLDIKIEISSWRNPVPNVWSVHIRDADSPMNFTNGKGASKEAAICSALGEYFERLSSNYFYSDYYLGEEISKATFVHYPNEKWFSVEGNKSIPHGLMDPGMLDLYNKHGELNSEHLIDNNTGSQERGICAIPFERVSDGQSIYVPISILGNLYASNGMSAGNTIHEARVQALSEIFERAIKNKIISEEIALPEIPRKVLEHYPKILEGVEGLEKKGFKIFLRDASLGGKYPVLNITLLNPNTGGAFSSYGSHPCFEVALERCLTELMQGRSFEGLNVMPPPTFNPQPVKETNNLVEHFIDSTGVISWKFFSSNSPYEFNFWDFRGTTQQEYDKLISILQSHGHETYIADYEDLGVNACRIIVPGFSEIYPFEDLVYENNNISMQFREDILNIHALSTDQLILLINKLEDYLIDDYRPVSEVIGISFDENSTWGELTCGELKASIFLAIKDYENAKYYVEQFSTFNDANKERNKLYQLINILLDIKIDVNLFEGNYRDTLTKLYGSEMYKNAILIVCGELKFFGLKETSVHLIGLEKHQRLLESYKKLQKRRKLFHSK
mgnify:CR=1 FL=1